jgi:hypothetical protein
MSALPVATGLDEFLSFILERLTPEEILAYKVSPAVQQRINTLVELNSEDGLNSAERLELDEILEFERWMTLLKSKALAAIYDRESNS